jgi:hypothetical protein
MAMDLVKLVVFVPVSHAEAVRTAIGDAGAGRLGNYSHCTFSSRGTGRFRPLPGANPYVGTVGETEVVDEERIEAIVEKHLLSAVVAAMRWAHPYEEVAFDLIPLLDPTQP